MNFLDRFLGHDRWTTKELLKIAEKLSENQLDEEFDIGHRSIRKTFCHMIRNLEIWTDLMIDGISQNYEGDSISEFIARHESKYLKFESFAKKIDSNGQWNETWKSQTEELPKERTYGGTIAHVITHNMHHRAQVLYLFRLSGIKDLPEGDVLSWGNSLK